jgi:hypothetical protein
MAGGKWSKRSVGRVVVCGVSVVVVAGGGFAAGAVFPPSVSGDPVRAQVRLAEDDFGKLYLGSASVADAYGVDRVVRDAPDTFFDSLPVDCDVAFARLKAVQGKYVSLADATDEGQAVWGQSLLVAQDVCTFDAYEAKFGEELKQWVARPRTDPVDSSSGGQVSSTTTEPAPASSVPSSTVSSTTLPVPPVSASVPKSSTSEVDVPVSSSTVVVSTVPQRPGS